MCVITKRINVSDVRQKKLAMRKRLQGELNLSFLKKSVQRQTYPNDIQLHEKIPTSALTDVSPSEVSKKKRNSILENDNEFFEKYQLLQKIGEGGHSTVYKCQEKETGLIFAVKVTRFRDQEAIINSQRQFELNKKVSNSSIIQLHELIVDEEKMTSYNVQEYCGFKNLKEQLVSRPQGSFSEVQALRVAKKILSTLQYLHSNNICHRDIKPDNILYNQQNGDIKLIDLECSKSKKQNESFFQMWTKTGTLNYQAPQYFLNTIFSQKVDVWAVGVVIYELVTGKLPFQSPYHNKTIQLIISSEINFQALKLSSHSQQFLKGLLEKQPNQRSSIEKSLIQCQKALSSIN